MHSIFEPICESEAEDEGVFHFAPKMIYDVKVEENVDPMF